MAPGERLCCLTLDEMSLKSKMEFDNATGRVIGGVTLPAHKGLANHALVFMIGGVTTRWKQTVAYYLTGQSVLGCVLEDIVLDIIKETHKIGLRIIAITSDMGAANRGLWKTFGISATSQGVHNKMPHPLEPGKYIYFLADVPHLFKNVKAALINGHTFTIPEDLCKEERLPSRAASIEPVKNLADFQVILFLIFPLWFDNAS